MLDVSGPNAQGKTFFDGFDKGFLGNFQENNPVEYSIFKEYATGTDMTLLTEDFRYYELAWRGFTPYSQQRSAELINMGAMGFYTSVYGPLNMLGAIPGYVGSAIGLYNNVGTLGSSANIMNLTTEAMNIRLNGPQVINEGLFRKSYGRGYDSSFN